MACATNVAKFKDCPDMSSSSASSLPLNLTILRLVRDFRKIPRGFLYDKVPASNTEIDKQVTELANKGAIKVEGDVIISTDP